MVPDWPCTVNIRYEVSRQIVATEEAVKCYKEGNRVVLLHYVHYNTCHYCLNGHHMVCETLRKTSFDPGGWVEYVRMPVININRGIFVLPDHVSYEDGTFVELLACVLRGQRLAHLQPGSSIGVISSGIAGLLHVMLARAFAAHRVIATDISEYRLEAARRLGADVTLHPQEDLPSRLCQVNQGLLADLVSAIAQALESVKRGGNISLFATTDIGSTTPIPMNDLFWRTEITLTTSYGGGPDDYQTALDLTGAKTIPITQLITRHFGLAEASKGFELVADGQNSMQGNN